VKTLNVIAVRRGLSGTIKTDNGSEFISKVMDKWAYEYGVELDFVDQADPLTMLTSPRMSERTLVLVIGRHAGQDRGLAPGLQR
jgi:hypothetical protein